MTHTHRVRVTKDSHVSYAPFVADFDCALPEGTCHTALLAERTREKGMMLDNQRFNFPWEANTTVVDPVFCTNDCESCGHKHPWANYPIATKIKCFCGFKCFCGCTTFAPYIWKRGRDFPPAELKGSE